MVVMKSKGLAILFLLYASTMSAVDGCLKMSATCPGAGCDIAISRWTGSSWDGSVVKTGACGDILPSGAILLILSGTCPAGWSEATALNGKTLRGTLAANLDVGTTGGLDIYTPAGTNSAPALAMNPYTPGGTNGTVSFTPGGTVEAPTFTGTPFSTIINHTHPVNITDPGHTHTMPTYTTDGSGTRPDNGSSTNGTTVTVPSNTTGITATSSNPSGGAASITPAGSNSAPAFTGIPGTVPAQPLTGIQATLTGTVAAPIFTGTPATVIPAYVKVIFCSKD
jgi:hypothetical protein